MCQADGDRSRGTPRWVRFLVPQPIYERNGQSHARPPPPTRQDVEPAIFRALAGDPRFGNIAVRHYDWDQTYAAPHYRKLKLSYSVTQMMNNRDRVGLLANMESFINERFDGHVTRPLVVTLTTATLV